MQKLTFTLIALFLLCIRLSGQNVEPSVAANIARNAYFQQQPAAMKAPLSSINPKLVYTAARSSLNCYYVFDISCGGFVIVSAFDAVSPVLGYAFTGSYLQQNQPPAFTHWMQDYRDQIHSAITLNLQAPAKVKEDWQRFSEASPKTGNGAKSVTPMILTTWDQGKFYNEYCPADDAGTDDHVVVGCVPIAMAQIMNYYRWPLQGTGSYSYTDTTYGVLSADFAATTYRWNEMPLKLTAYNSPVAELVYHLGVSVDLDYGPLGSGMYNHKAAYALRTYFGYSPLTEYVFRDTMTNLNWKQLVLDHLDIGRPLYYAGWADTINVSGHAFVCDGYQDTTYFHMNWGWEGYLDGFFMLDDLTPGVNDFTLEHELIINIAPEGDYPYYCQGADTLTAMNGNVEDGSGPLADYQQGADCSWLIAPDDSVSDIKLTFKKFSLNGPGDTVFVYNGNTAAAPLLGRYTGTAMPPVLTATDQYMLLRFVSDDSLTAGGWMAEYQTTLPVYCSGIPVLTAQAGSLSDGSGPRDYHNNSLCRWKIEPAGATSVSLHINALELAPDDYLEIYNTATMELLAKLIGDSIPGDLISPSGKMLLVFKTDSKNTAAGWEADYSNVSSVKENELLGDITIFPNPARDEVTVSGYSVHSGAVTLQLWNSALKAVWMQSVQLPAGDFSYSIPARQLASGLYLLRIVTGDEQSTHKILISE